MWTSSFWKASLERALKTFCQAMIAVLAVGHTTILTVDWQSSLAVAATATLLSVLTSIASSTGGNPGPSLATEMIVPPVVEHVGD